MYEIRNNINNKIYVGVHKTEVLDDGYMGSGKVIKYAIGKYGVDNFTKTILETFSTAEEMFAREKEIVTDEFLLREDTYNLRRGGVGGFEYINKDPELISKRLANRTADSYLKMREGGNNTQTVLTPVQRTQLGRAGIMAQLMRAPSRFAKLNLDSEFQEKRKLALRNNKHSQGSKNSQFGSMWITNGQENKKIKNTENIPLGWGKGRVIK